MNMWRNIVKIPKVVTALVKGQLQIYRSQLHKLKCDLTYTQAQPDGFVVWLIDEINPDGVSVPRDDYIAELQEAIAEVESHIANLGD